MCGKFWESLFWTESGFCISTTESCDLLKIQLPQKGKIICTDLIFSALKGPAYLINNLNNHKSINGKITANV